MTKERKVAIQMWENVVDQLPTIDNLSVFKHDFIECYPYEWKNDCWFCEYCRKDYCSGHVGREELERTANKCESCPLYKYEIARGNFPIVPDACGCNSAAWHDDVLWDKVWRDKDVEAAKIILRILKGEKIENLLEEVK